ncbi:MAG: hypothetical protein AMXMBFR4_08240 [Candidatus Hydrogenedentota bacterium]
MSTAAALAVAGRKTAAQAAKKYRACVIGDTQNGGYGHDIHMVWAARPDVEVVALADPDEEGRGKRGAECKAKTLYADYREMLEKEKPELVAVAPRTTVNHKEYVLACAEAGAHGFIEKPLCVDLAEADEMIAAIDAKKLKWAIGFNFRSMPVIEQVKKLIVEDRAIGSVLEVRGRGKEDARAGGEDLIVLGVHVFDLMTHILGARPQWCFADITTNGKPSTKADVKEATEPLGPIVGNRITATFGFAQGVPGYYATMFNRDGNGGRWGLDIHGSQGVISIRQDRGPEVSILKDPMWAPGASGKSWEPIRQEGGPAYDNPLERYSVIINDLIASIEEDRRPAVSVHDARDAHEMIQAVFDSHVQGGRVDIPLKERSHPLKRWT